MASRLGRSVIGWVLIALITTPYVGIICLYALGETKAARRARIIEEEEWRNKVSVKDYLTK